MPTDDPWADKPDALDEADREWAAKWSRRDDEAEPVEPPPAGYEKKKVTLDAVNDAYGEGMRQAGPHLGFGLQLGASMVMFVGLGLLFDRWLGTSPWGIIVGAIVGMVGIMTLVLRMAKQ